MRRTFLGVFSALAFASVPLAAFAEGSEQFQETPLPREAELTQTAVDLATAVLKKNNKGTPMHRGVHAKGHGCLRGELVMSPDRPAESRFGVFATDRTYPVWARFSNASSGVASDTIPDARGAALKLLGVPGQKLHPTEPNSTSQDFLFFTSPALFVKDGSDYVAVLKALSGKASILGTMLSHLKVAVKLAGTLGHGLRVTDPLETQFWSAGPYKLGPRAVKYSLRPCDGQKLGLNLKLNPDSLRKAMTDHLQSKGACFEFLVQFQTNAKEMPIEDFSVEWPTSASPYRKVATVTFPKQAFDSPAQQTFCENLSYNPWRVTADHRPLGNLNRMRRAVYEAISRTRHQVNKAPEPEPTGQERF
jgi:hypothetical protein